jgi:hypothetical protein
VDTNVKSNGQRLPEINVRAGRPPKYPWDEWEDGSAWRITRGEHFEIPPSNMAAVIRSRAHRLGYRASATVDGNAVEFRFFTGATA